MANKTLECILVESKRQRTEKDYITVTVWLIIFIFFLIFIISGV